MASTSNKKKNKADVKSGSIYIDDWDGDIVRCALDNDFEGVDAILAKDPRMINAQRRESGVTALIVASSRGMNEMVAHLLAKEGVDLFLRDDFGKDAFDHSILFPEITEMHMRARLPNMKWKEPYIGPV